MGPPKKKKKKKDSDERKARVRYLISYLQGSPLLRTGQNQDETQQAATFSPRRNGGLPFAREHGEIRGGGCRGRHTRVEEGGKKSRPTWQKRPRLESSKTRLLTGETRGGGKKKMVSRTWRGGRRWFKSDQQGKIWRGACRVSSGKDAN